MQGVPKKMTPFVIQMIPNGVFFFGTACIFSLLTAAPGPATYKKKCKLCRIIQDLDSVFGFEWIYRCGLRSN